MNYIIRSHNIKRAIRIARNSSKRTASSSEEIGVELLVRICTASHKTDFSERTAFARLINLVKKVFSAISKIPNLITHFLRYLDSLEISKRVLGKTAPGCTLVKLWANNQITLLFRAIDSIFYKITKVATIHLDKLQKLFLKIPVIGLLQEVLEEKNSWERLLEKASSKLPERVRTVLNKIDEGVKDLATFLKKVLSKSRFLLEISRPLRIYIFIKFFDWYSDIGNLPLVISGLLGSLSFSDLLLLVPGEILEGILKLFFPWMPQTLIFGGVTAIAFFLIFKEIRYLMKLHGCKDSKSLKKLLEKSKGEGIDLFEPLGSQA